MKLFIVLSLALCIAEGGSAAAIGAPLAGKPIVNEVEQKIARAEELFEQGHTVESRQICESLLRILSNHPDGQLAHTLNLMGKIYAADGDYVRAIRYSQQSAEIYEQVHDSGGKAHALNNKATAELQAGSYSDAQRDLENSLRLAQAANDLENQVQVLNNLGSAHYFEGSYSEGMSAYDEAMALINTNTSAKWTAYWFQITRFNQATLLQRLGRYDGALRIYREVEASSKTLNESDRAHLDANLGTLYRRLGDPYKALDAYGAAQKLYSKQHDADGETAVLKNIGIVYALDLEDLIRASSIFRSALALAQKTRNRREEMQAHLYLGETLLRMQLLLTAHDEFERTRTIADELATAEEQWKCLYGLGRIDAARGNVENAERDYRAAISLIEKSRSQLQLSALRSDFFADKREVYDALILMLLKKNDVNESFLFMERSRARNFQDRMQENRESDIRPLTLEQVRAGLFPATALLEFWTAGNQIGLIWCTRERTGVQLKQLTPEQQDRIQVALKEIPTRLQITKGGDDRSPFDAILGEWQIPTGIRHLQIVPDAWLSSVPFDLLRAEPGSDSPLIERYDITYLPSAALLRRTAADRIVRWHGPWTRELVAFGDPVVRTEPFARDSQKVDERWGVQPLPSSAKEIEEISRLTRGRAQIFLRQADLKTSFLNGTANTAPLLHVSTHAFADVDKPENSRLLFSAEGPDSGPAYIFLRELYDLDLRGVNLATISACDTEQGKITRGEGVQAFSRALLSAGARSSVTTLWRVDDEATSEFMKQFYYFLQDGQPKAEALRRAKLKFLHSRSELKNPSVWAAFVLNGDGQMPIPRFVSWTELALGGLILAAALLLIKALADRLGSR